jgi:7-cyano-7-deazaguanine synthase in queuosine biosynthesis
LRAVVYYDQVSIPSDFQKSDVRFCVGENLRTGIDDFRKFFTTSTSLEEDLLLVSSSIFAADLTFKRGEREEITRDIELVIPVVNFHALNSQKIELERILYFLSHDNWTLYFYSIPGQQEPINESPIQEGQTLLFSGGLDSLSAAVDLLDTHGASKLQLTSHITGNSFTRNSQDKLYSHLFEKYKDTGNLAHIAIRTGRQNPKNKDAEEDDEITEFTNDPEVSQRTRSFTFLTIAILSARRKRMTEIVYIAENGQMAIHLPLSAARIGSFSTHTAHPKFINEITTFFQEVLQHPLKITNPYVYKTKAEVVKNLCINHKDIINLSNSCWKSSRIGGKHCGECVPCFVRRIALEFNNISVDRWKVDFFQENIDKLKDDNTGKKNIIDLSLFAKDFRDLDYSELCMKHCDLYSEDFNMDEAIEMYKRFSIELKTIFLRYSNLEYLL